MGSSLSETLGDPEKIIEESKLNLKINQFRRFSQMEVLDSTDIEFEKVDMRWRVAVKPIIIGTKPAYCRVVLKFRVRNQLLWESAIFSLEVECKANGKNFFTPGYMKINQKCITTEFKANDPIVADSISSRGDLSLAFVITLKYCGRPSEFYKFLSAGANHNLMREKYIELYEDKYFCDFTFVVRKKKFKVPRNVLANASPYFLKLFTCDMKEAREQTCIIDHIDPRDFEKMLHFIFTGELPEGPHLGLFETARYFLIDSLEWLLAYEIQNSITPKNAVEIYKWAIFFSEALIANDAWLVIRNNPEIDVTSLENFNKDIENDARRLERERAENPSYELKLRPKIIGRNFHSVPCFNEGCVREHVYAESRTSRRDMTGFRKLFPHFFY